MQQKQQFGWSIGGGKYRHLAEKVGHYLAEWYPTTDPDFSIDWSQVELRVSGRMTKAYGKAGWNKTTDTMSLRLSKHITDDWDRAMQTVRHEAIHIWQYQTLEEADHGPSFLKWADKFGCKVNAPAPASDYKYLIVCENCGVVGGRHKRSKLVKWPHRYYCKKCNGGDLSVKRA